MSLDSARAVVATWAVTPRQGGWGYPAYDMTPSALTDEAAQAYVNVRLAADAEADRLAALGYPPSHTYLRELRGIASDAARRAQGLTEWADELEIAQNERETL